MPYYVCMRVKPVCVLWQNDEAIPQYGCSGSIVILAKTVEAAFMFGGFPCTIREVEPKGGLIDEGKLMALAYGITRGELVRVPWVDETMKFLESVSRMKFFCDQRPPRKEWRVFETVKEASVAAGKSPRGRAPDGCLNSDEYCARGYAMNAVAEALEAILTERVDKEPMGSLIDAVIASQLAVYSGLPLDEKFVAWVRAGWDVWERGYGLLGDYGGVLYVYRKP